MASEAEMPGARATDRSSERRFDMTCLPWVPDYVVIEGSVCPSPRQVPGSGDF